MRPWSIQRTLLVGVGASALLHGTALGVLSNRRLWKKDENHAVKVRITEVKAETKVEEPPPPKPPEIKKPKPPEKKIASQAPKPVEPPKEPPKPIQGLSEDSFDKSGKGTVAAPMGNTMMMEDTGERVKEAPPMDVDLSSDPQLVRDSITTPQYTDTALDANFEGSVTVEVLVDENGKVTQADLGKKVGYGMDQRILDAAYAARFIPRKNKLGRAEAGWTAIKFNMEIP